MADEIVDEGKQGDDVFGDAFDEATKIKSSKEDKSGEELLLPDELPKGKKEEKKEEKAEVKEKAEPKEKAEEETDKQRYLTLQGIFKHDKEIWDKEKAELSEKLEAANKKAPKEEQKTKEELEDDLLSPEDKEALKQYEEDFDTIAKMEGKKREIEFKKLKKELDEFKQSLLDELNSKLEPSVKSLSEMKVNAHFDAIDKAHPDREQYVDDGSIVKWIETKPKYLQKSMKEVYEKGTSDEVIELISDFKKENNIGQNARSKEQADLDAQKKAEADAAREKKKLDMTPPTTKRGAVNASMTVANDFKGAFEEAVSKIGG
jgi:hypothetical protein